MAAEPDDFLYPCHRDLGLYFIRGIHPRQVFAQYMGRVGGLTRGRDGNMHFGDPDGPQPGMIEMLQMLMGADSLIARALSAPGGALMGDELWNSPPIWQAEGIRVNAVCPGFAESKIVDPIREHLAAAGLPLIAAETVAETVVSLFAGEMTGECWSGLRREKTREMRALIIAGRLWTSRAHGPRIPDAGPDPQPRGG